jgi:hypothetical protein
MDPLPSFSSPLKALFQLDPASLALNALYRLGLKTGHYRRAEGSGLERLELDSSLHSLFSLPDRAQLLKIMGKAGQVALLKEADEIVKGNVRLFGAKPVPLRLTFGGPLRHWTQYESRKDQPPISKSTNFQFTDIKFIWEPARFGWAFILGRAYHVSGKEKYVETFWKYFREFDKGNPPYQGPHWMNGQEVAIRLMALVWSAQVFAKAAASTGKRRDRLAYSVAEHASRIPPTLIYARSQNNNHLLVEAAGLYTAGLSLHGHPRAGQWRTLGQRWLNWCFTHQISQLGEYIQHSTNYHRLMLHVALWLCGLNRDDGADPTPVWLSPKCKDNLRRATQWLFSMVDPESGQTPNLGANDGSLLLPLSPCAFDDYRPTVQAACRAFLGMSLPAGPWDELSLWLDLPLSRQAAALPSFVTDPLRGRNSRGYLRASSFKSRLSHMDQLHFDLWWRGLNVAQDPGTYLYNAATPWDNPLVSSRVHNTVTVDGHDQMTRGGRFLTLDWCPAHFRNLPPTESKVLSRMLAYHAGYERLGVRHERVATAFIDGHWEITDSLILTKPGEHVFRLHWLLPDWKWKLEDRLRGVEVRLKSPRGAMAVLLRTTPGQSNLYSRVSLVRGGQLVSGAGRALPFEGWASPTYGVKVPALSLALEVASSRSVTLTTEFVLPK